ncbi:MAG: transposase [Desulfobacteraceae bacterium]|nr:transposase [Desulfobacteraceae bacterium]
MSPRNIIFRIYPSSKQRQQLFGWLALHRELYNAALQERRDAYKSNGVSLSYNHQQNELPAVKEARPELVPLGSHALQETVRRVDRAYQAFFRRIKAGEVPGYHRFKGRDRFESFTYPDPNGWKVVEQKEGKGRLRITNLGTIPMRGKPRVRLADGESRTLTIRAKADKWYAVIGVRYPETALQRNCAYSDRAVGIDVGCKALVASSDGDLIDNPRHLARAQEKLCQVQVELSRKKKDSRRRFKLKAKVVRLHATVANRRKDFLHQLSAAMVQLYPLIAVENLKLKNMTRSARGTVEAPGKNVKQKAGLNRSMLDAGIGLLFQMLAYKAEEAGGRYVEVVPNGTTQKCFWCGKTVSKDLSVRWHQCPHCGFSVDRDYNAALNILFLGLTKAGWEPSKAWRRASLAVNRETTSMLPLAA